MGRRQVGHRDTGGRGQYINSSKGTRAVGSAVRVYAPLPLKTPSPRFPLLPVRDKSASPKKCAACRGWGLPWKVLANGTLAQVKCRACSGTGIQKRRSR